MINKFFSSLLLSTLILVSLVSVTTLYSSGTQTSGINVSGIITTDTTWVQASSPYNLTANVLVNLGVTLKIAPGVTVNLNGFSLMVNGTLQAMGTDACPITFATGGQVKFTQFSTSWIESTGTGCIIENAVVSSALVLCGSTKIASNTITGGISVGDTLDLGKGTPIICNNTIQGQGISLPASDNVQIYGNTISGCPEAGIRATDNGKNNITLIEHNLIVNNTRGIEIWVSTGIQSVYNYILSDNTITNNTIGITLTENWYPEPISTTILNNNIYSNSLYNLDLGYTGLGIPYNINASNNWWGTIDIQEISKTIYDYSQNYNLGKAAISPILTTPNTMAPTCIVASAENGGSITPSGVIALAYGDNQAFTIVPDFGYRILDVAVNGTSIGSVSSYTIQSIQGLTSITATFTAVSGPTSVSGIIASNTKWPASGSPYNLNGNILVNKECTLTIEAGSTVNLNGYFIEINGTLIARGTGNNPIKFNNGYQAQQGIIFDPTSASWDETTQTGSIIQNAVLDSVGLFVSGAKPRIDTDLFYNSGKYTPAPYAIAFLGPATSTAAMIISNNTFASSYSLAAIDISSVWSPPPVIMQNNFLDKSTYHIDLWYNTPDVNATYNWWGTIDTEAVNQTIYDYFDNFQFGKVTFVPLLTGPNTLAPAYTPTSSPTPTPNPSQTPTPTQPPNSTPQPTNPPSNPTPSPSPPSTNQSKIPTLEISCQSSTNYHDFQVLISGRLTQNGSGIANAPILLSDSVNNGNSWIDLTTANTDRQGEFKVSWNAQVSGSYLVKATYEGNSVYFNTSTIVSFVVTPFQEQSVFSITSNSTITALYFNSTSNQLSFVTNGTSGTTGYVDLYVPKSLINDASNLHINLDRVPLTYTATTQGDSWLISFAYHQSSHHVTVDLAVSSGVGWGIDPTVQWIIVSAAIVGVAVLTVSLIVWKRKARTSTA